MKHLMQRPMPKLLHDFLLEIQFARISHASLRLTLLAVPEHGLVRIADIGLVPAIRDGIKGFTVYLGGGLGAASFIGRPLEEFTPEDKLLSTCMATIRLFDRHGNRENMARNRMRYLVQEMGWNKFQRMILKERSIVEMTTASYTAKLFDVKAEDKQLPNIVSTTTKLPVIDKQISLKSSGTKDGYTLMLFHKNRKSSLQYL